MELTFQKSLRIAGACLDSSYLLPTHKNFVQVYYSVYQFIDGVNFIVLATSQFCTFSGECYALPVLRRLTILELNLLISNTTQLT